MNWVVCRLEKLAEVFYTYVGDLQSVAEAVELDVDTVDVVFHYWLLKRKVLAIQPVYFTLRVFTYAYLRAVSVWY